MKHVEWLMDAGQYIATADGKPVLILEFCPVDDPVLVSAWAKHFRNHYCLDAEIDELREGTGCSRSDYLTTFKFPSPDLSPGPSIRAGDFSEILVADYLEYALGYWIPRWRYDRKTIHNESTKGTDVLGFKLCGAQESPDDAMVLAEVKAQLSESAVKPRLQDAVDDSVKDELRKAESLNALKQRLRDKHLLDEARRVARFQNPVDKPYQERPYAVAVFSATAYDETIIAATCTSAHPARATLTLIAIRGKDLMSLVHKLYRKAADEA